MDFYEGLRERHVLAFNEILEEDRTTHGACRARSREATPTASPRISFAKRETGD